MRKRDVGWNDLDRLEWHLWLLAIFLMFVLGVALTTFMFPSAFWTKEDLAAQTSRQAFWGFCVLECLTLVYLLQRQAKIRQLRIELCQAQAAIEEAEQTTAIQAFTSLPDKDQFLDALAMEFRRASTINGAMAAIVLSVRSATPELLGRATSHLKGMLRTGETMYSVSDDAIGIILPKMQLQDAVEFTQRLQAEIEIPKAQSQTVVTAFPEEVSSMAEMKARLDIWRKQVPATGAASVGVQRKVASALL